MSKRTFVTTGFVHRTSLVHEFGYVPNPLKVHHTLDDYDAAYPPDTRDEYEDPIRVTITYEIEVNDVDLDDMIRVLAEIEVDDSEGVLEALIGD